MMARALTTAWQGMGGWRWPCLALVIIPFLLTPYAGPSPESRVSHGAQTAGPYSVHLETQGHLRPGGRIEARATVIGARPDALSIGASGGDPRIVDLEAGGAGWTATVDLPVPESAAPYGVTVLVSAAGEDHRFEWSIGMPLQP